MTWERSRLPQTKIDEIEPHTNLTWNSEFIKARTSTKNKEYSLWELTKEVGLKQMEKNKIFIYCNTRHLPSNIIN